MSRSAQGQFNGQSFKKMRAFGGALLKKAKNRHARPLSTKEPLHLVLRSSRARGDWSFYKPRNRKIIQEGLSRLCRKYGVKVEQFANAGNHLHLLLRIKNRQTYFPFIRGLTGLIALQVTASTKLKQLCGRFWDARPFTRVVFGWRGYQIAKDYVLLNQLESWGVVPYQRRRLNGLTGADLRELLESSS
ncbi:MAG: transposase [Bdellovibrionales bacterium]